MELVRGMLEKNRKASYAEISEAAKKKGIKIYPIVYGRAQALLGIVKSAPRGQGKAKQAAAASAARPKAALKVAKRGPGRPRKVVSGAVGSLEGIISAMKENENSRERYRRALEKISTILQEVM